jgi:hypothetical protein
MHVTRRIDACLNCGETREMAAHGLCFKCYRREDRADDRQFALVDPHSAGLRKEHRKTLRGFTNVMARLADEPRALISRIWIRNVPICVQCKKGAG